MTTNITAYALNDAFGQHLGDYSSRYNATQAAWKEYHKDFTINPIKVSKEYHRIIIRQERALGL